MENLEILTIGLREPLSEFPDRLQISFEFYRNPKHGKSRKFLEYITSNTDHKYMY